MHDLVSPCQLCRGVRWIPPGGTPLCNGTPTPDTVTHITWMSGLCGGVGQAFVTCLVYPKARRGGQVHAAGTRILSTGSPVQGRRVDEESRVRTAPDGGVRFGGYTGPMTTQTTLESSTLAVPTAPAVAAGR